MKKLLKIFVVLMMICGLLSVRQYRTYASSGKCGDNVTWIISGSELIISGTGEMYNYSWTSSSDGVFEMEGIAPWCADGKVRNSIKTITIKSGVTSIGMNAFAYCRSAAKVNIANTVKKIGDAAFYFCDTVSSLEIPNSVTEIGANAFYRCAYLPKIVIPNSVTTMGSGAFCNCARANSLVISNKLKTLESEVFYGCGMINSVTIPGSVKKIGYGAFSLTALEAVTVPDGVTDITGAFKSCHQLKSVTLPNTVTNISEAFADCFAMENITIPESVVKMDGAFARCSKLTSVIIPSIVTSIGDNTFEECKKLTSISIPDGVKTIGMSAFAGCTGLTSVSFPDSVTEIASYAFMNCTGIKTIRFSDNLTYIADEAFENCSSLTKIVFPDSLEVSDIHSFDHCSNLKTVVIGSGVTVIRAYSFKDCPNLTTVYISNTVETIASGAFKNTGLTDIYFGGTKEEWDAIKIEDMGNMNAQVLNATVHYGYTITPVAEGENVYGTGVKLTWKETSNASKYRIYRTEKGTEPKKLKEVTAAEYTDTSAKCGTEYTYTVSAYDSVLGIWSANSNKVECMFNPFKDVNADANYFEALSWAYNNKIVYGTTGKLFSPDKECTRAQIAVMLWKMNGKPEVTDGNPFSDIGNCKENVQQAIIWCYSKGIVGGYKDGTFKPDDPVTRAQMAVMLWRLAGKPGVSGQTTPFTDLDDCGLQTIKAITWAYNTGIAKGVSSAKYNPGGACLRKQLVIFLYRFHNQ